MIRKFLCNDQEPVVITKAGKLRGFELDGVYSFHGIEYASAKRFQMPKPVQAWEGIRDATNYGYICPVDGDPAPKGEIYIPHRFWPANEHCQFLNVWTMSLDKNAKKPVMVWLHGGGFANGSSIEQVAYEGDELAKFGDVVVITLNHRLNILGYLDMSAYGEQYHNSVNAGMADIVEALRWVHENVEAFGGDPDNITVFGQSGGGSKIQALMQIPEASGLFHKAIIMSGILAPTETEESIKKNRENHKIVIAQMLEELQIPDNQPQLLEEVPYYLLMKAFNNAHLQLLKNGSYINWGPIPNEWYIGDPMAVGFSDYAKEVPTMVGTVIAEFSEGINFPDENKLSYDEKCRMIREKYGEYAQNYIELFQNAYPEKDLTRLINLDLNARMAAINFIEEKAKVSPSPSYLYLFGLDFEVNGKRPAWHCSDIPFVFHNTFRVPCCNIEGVTERLEQEMAGAWVSFAYSGNPNHPGMCKWPVYKDGKSTMVFDRKSAPRRDYDRVLIGKMLSENPQPDMAAIFAKKKLEAMEEGKGSDWLY